MLLLILTFQTCYLFGGKRDACIDHVDNNKEEISRRISRISPPDTFFEQMVVFALSPILQICLLGEEGGGGDEDHREI